MSARPTGPADESGIQARLSGAPNIPGYELHSVVGRGSSGVVYAAKQLAVDRMVAVKVLHPELVGTRAVLRLQREARTTARLAHSGIVSAIDMGQVGGLWWYAMELVDGDSLAEILTQRGRLSEREALKLFIPLCEALQHAFVQGVVHRDIKPGNILVDRSRRARLVDLGLAFTEDDLTLTGPGGTLGTPYYISPEQARDPSLADVRSDIWSFGATLFHAVCGRPPFAGESAAEILSGVLYSRIPDPRSLEPQLSRNLALVLRKCLSRDPDRRYQEPRELLADLELHRERRQVGVKPRRLDPLLGEERAARRNRILAAAVLLPALGFLGWRALAPRGTGPGPEEVAAVPYPPLEDLAARLGGDPVRAATLLVEVEALAAEVPPRSAERYAEVLAGAHREYRAVLGDLRRSAQQRLDEHWLGDRDWRAAWDYLEDELPETLRSELRLSSAQRAEFLASDWMVERRERADERIDEALVNLGEGLMRYYLEVVVPRVETHERRQDWRGARRELQVDVEDWLRAAAVDTAGLPPERVEQQIEGLRVAVSIRLSELVERWRALDAELASFVASRAEELTLELRAREPVQGAAEELRDELAARLEELRLAPRDGLTDVSRQAWQALERYAAELEALERDLLHADAELWFQHRSAELAPLWPRRRYGEIAEAWRAATPGDWPGAVRDRVEQRRLEAGLLEDLLGLAAAGVRERDGQQVDFFIGSIAVRGTLVAGADVEGRGFELRATATGTREGAQVLHRLALAADVGEPGTQVVLAEDLERLAGLPEDPARNPDPRLRLMRALFRYHEGNLEAAADTLAAGILPGGELRPLVEDLEQRIREASNSLRARDDERLAEAKQLYVLAKRQRLHGNEDASALRRIDRLLLEFLDLEWVRERESELRTLRRELESPTRASPEESFASSFAPDELEILPGERVRMAFGFAGGGGSSWSRGDWSGEPGGWIAPGVASQEGLFRDAIWPHLVLRTPLEIENPGVLEVDFTIEQPRESGPPRLMILSVAGVHVGFAGAQGGAPPRWSVSSGRVGLRELFDLLTTGGGESFDGLVRGEEHAIRVALSRGRGRARVFLDGTLLGARTLPSPDPEEPGGRSLALRSIEPVRLMRVELEGTY